MCCFYRVAGRKNVNLQRQTNREERKVDEWVDYSETDWLRTTDGTRKEEKIRGGGLGRLGCNNEEEYHW